MNRTLRHMAILPMLVLAVAACDSNGVTDPDPDLAVTLTPDNVQLTVGETAELTVGITGGPPNVTPSISCQSSSTSVVTATVSGNACVVQAVGAGSATVTANVQQGDQQASADAAVSVEPAPDPEPSAVLVVSGDEQTLNHSETSEDLVVQVNDQFGDPFPGAEVTFSGSGVAHSLSSTSETTDGSGQASVTVTAGTEDGTVTVEAEVADVGSVTFTLTVEDPAASAIVVASGDGQTLDHAETSADLVVQVNDQFGDPFPGAEVTFTGSGVAHSLSSTSETTDESGQASVTATAGTEDGTITVEAEVADVGSVTFTLTVQEGGLPPSSFATDFSEYTIGEFPNDWTDRGLEAAASSITVESDNGDNVLRIDLPEQDPGLDRGISWDAPGTQTDVRVEASVVPGTGAVPAYVTARGTAEDTYYRLQIRDEGLLELVKVVEGVPTVPISEGETSFSYSASDTVHFEFEVEGNELRGRAWLNDDTRPADWMVEVTDDDISSEGWTGVGRLDEGVTDFLSFTVTLLD